MIHFLIRWALGKPIEQIIRPYYRKLLMSISALEGRLVALNNQLSKVAGEINGKLDELRDQLIEAGQVPEGVIDLLDQIQATVDGLDAIVPDAEPADPMDPEEG